MEKEDLPEVAEEEMAEVPSIDEVLSEREMSSRWQTLMIVLTCLTVVHTGMFVLSPTVAKAAVPYTCLGTPASNTNFSQVSPLLSFNHSYSGDCVLPVKVNK